MQKKSITNIRFASLTRRMKYTRFYHMMPLESWQSVIDGKSELDSRGFIGLLPGANGSSPPYASQEQLNDPEWVRKFEHLRRPGLFGVLEFPPMKRATVNKVEYRSLMEHISRHEQSIVTVEIDAPKDTWVFDWTPWTKYMPHRWTRERAALAAKKYWNSAIKLDEYNGSFQCEEVIAFEPVPMESVRRVIFTGKDNVRKSITSADPTLLLV